MKIDERAQPVILPTKFSSPRFVIPFKVEKVSTASGFAQCRIALWAQPFNFKDAHTASCHEQTRISIGMEYSAGRFADYWVCEGCIERYWGRETLIYAYKYGVLATGVDSRTSSLCSFSKPCNHQGCSERAVMSENGIEHCLEHAFQVRVKFLSTLGPNDYTYFRESLAELYKKFPETRPQEFPKPSRLFPHSHYASNNLDEAVQRAALVSLDASAEWRELQDLGRRSRYELLSAEKINRAAELRQKFIAQGIIKEN